MHMLCGAICLERLAIACSGARSVWSALSPDPAGKLREVFSSPGGAAEISRWWSKAQPPGLVIEDFLRPGRDAGPEFSTGPIPVRRPFRARGPVVTFPVAALRYATG